MSEEPNALSDVDLGHRLATAADALSLGFFGRDLEVVTKQDGTPVSAADLAVEAALLDLIGRYRPGDGVLSEESGVVARPSARRWILDPIDGTAPFLAGERSWGTHVALEVDGELRLALITRPTERRRWWAVRGRGAWSSADDHPTSTDQRLSVSTTAMLSSARLAGFVDPDSDLAGAVREHAQWVADPLGDIIGLVEGRVDAVLGPAGQPWDHAPQVLLTTEAGGRYTDRAGGTRIDAGGGLYTNGLLDDQIQSVRRLRVADWSQPSAAGDRGDGA